jgi:hypothetical protein
MGSEGDHILMSALKCSNLGTAVVETGNYVQMADGTGTPVTFPLSSTSTLIVPSGAIRCWMVASAATTVVSLTKGSTGQPGSFLLLTTAWTPIPCAGMGDDSTEVPNKIVVTISSGTVQGFWEMV